MIIKNIGNELVFIGDISLMPGDEITIANTIAQDPLVQVLAAHGQVRLSDEPLKKAKVEAPAEDAKTLEPDTTEYKRTLSGKKGKKSTAKSE